jgi:hypothetical protein
MSPIAERRRSVEIKSELSNLKGAGLAIIREGTKKIQITLLILQKFGILTS